MQSLDISVVLRILWSEELSTDFCKSTKLILRALKIHSLINQYLTSSNLWFNFQTTFYSDINTTAT